MSSPYSQGDCVAEYSKKIKVGSRIYRVYGGALTIPGSTEPLNDNLAVSESVEEKGSFKKQISPPLSVSVDESSTHEDKAGSNICEAKKASNKKMKTHAEFFVPFNLVTYVNGNGYQNLGVIERETGTRIVVIRDKNSHSGSSMLKEVCYAIDGPSAEACDMAKSRLCELVEQNKTKPRVNYYVSISFGKKYLFDSEVDALKDFFFSCLEAQSSGTTRTLDSADPTTQDAQSSTDLLAAARSQKKNVVHPSMFMSSGGAHITLGVARILTEKDFSSLKRVFKTRVKNAVVEILMQPDDCADISLDSGSCSTNTQGVIASAQKSNCVDEQEGGCSSVYNGIPSVHIKGVNFFGGSQEHAKTVYLDFDRSHSYTLKMNSNSSTQSSNDAVRECVETVKNAYQSLKRLINKISEIFIEEGFLAPSDCETLVPHISLIRASKYTPDEGGVKIMSKDTDFSFMNSVADSTKDKKRIKSFDASYILKVLEGYDLGIFTLASVELASISVNSYSKKSAKSNGVEQLTKHEIIDSFSI